MKNELEIFLMIFFLLTTNRANERKSAILTYLDSGQKSNTSKLKLKTFGVHSVKREIEREFKILKNDYLLICFNLKQK